MLSARIDNTSSTSEPESAHTVFSGIGQWPVLDEALNLEGEHLIDVEGFGAFLDSGGRYNTASGIKFDATSEIAQRVITRILQDYPGFLWQDNSSTLWAVAVDRHPPQTRPELAYAVNWHGNPRPLDSELLLPALRRAEQQLERLFALGENRSPNESVTLEWLARRCPLARQIDLGLRLLPELIRRADQPPRRRLCISLDESLWPRALPRPAYWRLSLDNAISGLAALQVAKLRWQRPVWEPVIVRTGYAISDIQNCKGGRKVSVSPLLAEVVRAFEAAGCHNHEE